MNTAKYVLILFSWLVSDIFPWKWLNFVFWFVFKQCSSFFVWLVFLLLLLLWVFLFVGFLKLQKEVGFLVDF